MTTSTPSLSEAERLGVSEDVHTALRLLADARRLFRVMAASDPVRPLHRSGLHLAQKIADLIGDPDTRTPGTFSPGTRTVPDPAPAGPVALPVVLGWPMGLRHHADLEHLPTWPTGWPVPQIGDAVTFRSVADELTVEAVHWLPEGEDEADPEPGVYVVLRRIGDRS